MTNVVQLIPKPESNFTLAWAMTPKSMKKRSEGLSRLKPLWEQHARRFGPDALLASYTHYLKDDKDLPRSGGPGLQVWLRACKYELWAEDELRENPAITLPRPEFPDAKLRAAFFLRFQDEKARRWFDGCTLDGDTLIWPSPPTLEWAEGALKPWAILNGLGGWRSR